MRNEEKPKSVRRPLRALSNNSQINSCNGGGGGGGGLSKSMNADKKSISKKELQNQRMAAPVNREQGGGGDADEDYLDRLLLVQSDLSSLTRQVTFLWFQEFSASFVHSQFC